MTTGGYRVRCACGVLGPLAFTGAWIAATILQEGRDGYSFRDEHISGLAAADARTPVVMVAGFLVLGICLMLFAPALAAFFGRANSARAGVALLYVAGAAAIAAGFLRRDRMLLTFVGADSVPPPSWHARGHDIASGVAYACMLAAPLVFARAPAESRETRRVRPVAWAAVGSSGILLGLFWSKALEQHNGILQRIAVTIPLLGLAALALWMGARGPAPKPPTS